MRDFDTTRWSLIRRVGDLSDGRCRKAFEELYTLYCPPLFSFILARGFKPQDAEDLLQDFFVYLIEKRTLERADADRGKLRDFLQSCLKNFLENERAKRDAKKRRPDKPTLSLDRLKEEYKHFQVVSKDLRPDQILHRRWRANVLRLAMEHLARKYASPKRAASFKVLSQYLPRSSGNMSYDEAGKLLGISANAVKARVRRLRKDFDKSLFDVVADTVASPKDVEKEMRDLLEDL